jgi:hypothetical protein
MVALIIGVFVTLCGLAGAVLAANAMDIGMYSFGLGLIGFAVVVDFWLTKEYFDELERGEAG